MSKYLTVIIWAMSPPTIHVDECYTDGTRQFNRSVDRELNKRVYLYMVDENNNSTLVRRHEPASAY